jgi:transcriptional regulator with XRE-family HTH domain
MYSIEEIRSLLNDRKLSVVAENTGISYQTLLAIKNGTQTNPKLKTIQVLDSYLRDGWPQ